MRNPEISGIRDIFDYLFSDPDKVWSGAMRSYHKLNNQYVKICRDELHDAEIGIYDTSRMAIKNRLQNKIQKLRRVLSTRDGRKNYRFSEFYMRLKAERFRKKLDKF
jgi:hypothetical protein